MSNNYGLDSYFSAVGNTYRADKTPTSDWASQLVDQERDFYLDSSGALDNELLRDTSMSTTISGLSNALPGIAGGSNGDSGSWFNSAKNLVGDKDFMSGALGLGNLGLGLANYFQMAPVYEQQLKSMKLANKDMEQSMARQQATRTGLAEAIAKNYG